MKHRDTNRADTTAHKQGKALVLALVALTLIGTAQGHAGPQADQVQPGIKRPTPAATTAQVKLINGNELEPLKATDEKKATNSEPASAHCDYKTNSYGKFYVCEISGEKQK